jgi:hypothetical protein
VDDHLLPNRTRREWLDSSEGACIEKDESDKDVTVCPAIVVPSGNGLITVPHERDEIHSAETIVEAIDPLTVQEWETIESMGNLCELLYDGWSDTLTKSQIEYGPPMDSVVAISYVDETDGEFITVKGVEHFRTPYVPELDADGAIVPITPINVRKKVDLRTIHYFYPAMRKASGNWSSGRYNRWTKPTTRPFEMWPEVWNSNNSLQAKAIAIAQWKEEVKRRDVIEAKARERETRRGRTIDPNQERQIPGSRHMPVQALAATLCDFENWMPWLDNINKKLDLEIPDMLLQQRDLREHLLPPKHREKNTDMPWNCCVARPVFEDEIRRSAGAQKALRKDWDRLRLINTWREDLVEEWDVVKARAKKTHTRVHMGVVFQICVEKDSETEKPERLRKYKGRVVFRGNDVVDENCDIAMFQELGSAPATMVAAKACDLYGLLKGHVVENADATLAYTQSLLGGTATWVSLPSEEWPASWRNMRRPVCPLEKALCGHPDAGGYWEQHCDNHLRDCGFNPVAVGDRAWCSCFFSPTLTCYMIVYVDDFKIAGPKDNVEKAW